MSSETPKLLALGLFGTKAGMPLGFGGVSAGTRISSAVRRTTARIETFLVTVAIGTIIGSTVFVVLFRTIRHQGLAAVLMVATFGVGSWLLFEIPGGVRTAGRWLIQSARYKAEILAQPNPANGELKHTEWDGWGFAGADTTVYLVFDPNDSLRGAAARRSPGKYGGIPCDVFSVRRLENHWYAVQFYTNTDWNNCR